ncbi:MAG: phage integrase N-terminal SAM-like domain-containing protein [Aureispira sp.]|nr:phage integrase N-terminal SAM-like domain-containing protein [Aureispira sp.]
MKSKRSVISEAKVIHPEVEKELKRLKKRMSVAHRSKATIISYSRGLKKRSDFSKKNPKDLEYDELIGYLVYLKDDLGLQWRTIKLYVAGLRYYYQEIIHGIRGSPRRFFAKDKKVLLV